MEGKFHHKNAAGGLGLLSGLFLIALYFFLRYADPQADGSLGGLVVLGALIALFGISSLLFNFRAYIRVQDGRLQARYHWFGRLDCPLEEVSFVLPQLNTLTVLLKNGKRHTISGVTEPFELCHHIRLQTFRMEQEDPAALRARLGDLKTRRKRELFLVMVGICAMFGIIALATLLTGGRDLGEFGTRDWIVMAVMGVVELVTVGLTFLAAQMTGSKQLLTDELTFRLRGAVIATHPLPGGNVTAVYTDADRMGRVTLCRIPGGGVYYQVEEFDASGLLYTDFTSEVADSEEDLPMEALSTFFDITEYFP